MRIAMLASSYPRFRGDMAGTFVRALAEALAAGGNSVEVFAPRDPALNRPPAGRARVHWYRYSIGDSTHVLGYGRALEGDQRLRRLAVATMPGYLASGLAALIRRHLAWPFDLIHGHWLLPGGFLAALAGVMLRRPVVTSLHGSDLFVGQQGRFRPAAAWAIQRADALVACSPGLVERAESIAAPRRAVVIPYGVDVTAFGCAPDRPGSPVVAAVGRLVEKKGFATLVAAAPAIQAAVPGTRIVIGGDGPIAADLRRQAAGLGVDIRFPGAVPHSAMAAFLAGTDVFCVPSIVDSEGNLDGLPNVVVEGMAAGRAVVASRLGGIPIAITAETGVLVSPGDADELAGAVIALLRNPTDRAALGRRARQRMIDRFSWGHIAAAYEAIYQGQPAPPFDA